MKKDEINKRLDDFSHDDAEFAAFVMKCDKLYWLYDKEKVLNLVTETFSSLPIGTKTRCIQIINDALQFEESKVIGYGRVYIFKDYFILADDLFSIWKSLLNYAETIHRKISFTDVYGYSSASSPKLGLPYNITFVIKEL